MKIQIKSTMKLIIVVLLVGLCCAFPPQKRQERPNRPRIDVGAIERQLCTDQDLSEELNSKLEECMTNHGVEKEIHSYETCKARIFNKGQSSNDIRRALCQRNGETAIRFEECEEEIAAEAGKRTYMIDEDLLRGEIQDELNCIVKVLAKSSNGSNGKSGALIYVLDANDGPNGLGGHDDAENDGSEEDWLESEATSDTVFDWDLDEEYDEGTNIW